MARLRNLSLLQGREFIEALKALPAQIRKVLDRAPEVEKLADRFAKAQNALYLGRGVNFPVALEGALKLKEISYIHAEGYPAAEMKHGPIALIDENMPVVFIAPTRRRAHQDREQHRRGESAGRQGHRDRHRGRRRDQRAGRCRASPSPRRTTC